MQFKKRNQKLSLELLADKEIKIEFPEGPRTGIIKETDNPSHPYSFNFTKNNIKKELFLREDYLKFEKKEIKYNTNFYAIENHF